MLYLIIATRNKNSSLLIILWSSVGQNNSTSNKTKQNSIPPQSSPPTYTYIVYHHSFSLFRYPFFCCQYPVKFFLFSKSSVLYPHISKSSNTSSLVPFFPIYFIPDSLFEFIPFIEMEKIHLFI